MGKVANEFAGMPIQFEYDRPSQSFIAGIKKDAQASELSEKPGILIENRYYRNGIEGSLPRVYLRSFIASRLQEALKKMQSEYGFVIFDGYRGMDTQAGLFNSYFKQIKDLHPDWLEEKLHTETRKFVAHPDEPSRFEVPPHNSGGAVDLGLTYSGRPVDMGTDFDDLTEKAATDYFERPYDSNSNRDEASWESLRIHRRILFHSLRTVGFFNWKYEWWHFDIGDCVWSQELGLPWIYDSMTPHLDSLLVRNAAEP